MIWYANSSNMYTHSTRGCFPSEFRPTTCSECGSSKSFCAVIRGMWSSSFEFQCGGGRGRWISRSFRILPSALCIRTVRGRFPFWWIRKCPARMSRPGSRETYNNNRSTRRVYTRESINYQAIISAAEWSLIFTYVWFGWERRPSEMDRDAMMMIMMMPPRYSFFSSLFIAYTCINSRYIIWWIGWCVSRDQSSAHLLRFLLGL